MNFLNVFKKASTVKYGVSSLHSELFAHFRIFTLVIYGSSFLASEKFLSVIFLLRNYLEV